jgi:alanine dehydrogenase
VHYGVTNMPGAVAGTSTYALTNDTLPYVRQLADLGWRAALRENPALRAGLNVALGEVVLDHIAELFHLPLRPVEPLLASEVPTGH